MCPSVRVAPCVRGAADGQSLSVRATDTTALQMATNGTFSPIQSLGFRVVLFGFNVEACCAHDGSKPYVTKWVFDFIHLAFDTLPPINSIGEPKCLRFEPPVLDVQEDTGSEDKLLGSIESEQIGRSSPS